MAKDTGQPEGELNFSVLGPLRGTRGKAELNLGPARQQAVLTTLLLGPGAAVAVPEIIDGVWGEEVPASGVGVVHAYLSRLRRILGSEVIGRSVGGYEIRLGGGRLDLQVFEQSATEADERSRAGDLEGSALAWRKGLALWRGVPLAGVTGPFAESQRQTLAELHLDSLEKYWSIELELGGHHEIVPELLVAVRDHPFRERFVALLMVALYRCGRQAEALAAFDRTHRTLAGELNISPSTELRHLRNQILDADDELRENTRRFSGPGATTSGSAPHRPLDMPPDFHRQSYVGRCDVNPYPAWSDDVLEAFPCALVAGRLYPVTHGDRRIG